MVRPVLARKNGVRVFTLEGPVTEVHRAYGTPQRGLVRQRISPFQAWGGQALRLGPGGSLFRPGSPPKAAYGKEVLVQLTRSMDSYHSADRLIGSWCRGVRSSGSIYGSTSE